jgi:hypothetical protein
MAEPPQASWAASCEEHVLGPFESAQPEDPRPRQAIEHARAWVRGEIRMTQARTAAGHAMAAARDLPGAARHAAYAAGQAGAVAHIAAHELGAAAYAIKAARAGVPECEGAGRLGAGGSVTSSRRRFASSCLTTSGCGTTSAGGCLTAERASGAPAPPTTASSERRELTRPIGRLDERQLQALLERRRSRSGAGVSWHGRELMSRE